MARGMQAPGTVQLVEGLIDVGMIARRVCFADGRLSPDELALLQHLRLVTVGADELDLQRLEAISYLNHGEINGHLLRRRRELEARKQEIAANEVAACPGEDDAA